MVFPLFLLGFFFTFFSPFFESNEMEKFKLMKRRQFKKAVVQKLKEKIKSRKRKTKQIDGVRTRMHRIHYTMLDDESPGSGTWLVVERERMPKMRADAEKCKGMHTKMLKLPYLGKMVSLAKIESVFP